MGLSDVYEPVQAYFLHRIPLPTLDQAFFELLSEETRLGLILTSHVDTTLATLGSRGRGPSSGSRGFSTSCAQFSSSTSQHNKCTFCHAIDHRLLTYPARVCKHCRQRGPGHYQSDCPKNTTHRDTRLQSTTVTIGVSSTTSASPTLIDVSDLLTFVQQIMSAFGNPFIALSASSGISPWYFDSGYSNHMTFDLSIFSSKSYESSFPVIYTTNGSSITVDHVGHVSTSTLSLPHTYCVHKLTLNFVFVGQLCDLGLTVLFSSIGCVVQDPRTGQTLGIGRRHGQLFQLVHLHLFIFTAATTSASSSPSFGIWHSRLGHVSLGWLRFLLSKGVLGLAIIEHLNCQFCQLAK